MIALTYDETQLAQRSMLGSALSYSLLVSIYAVVIRTRLLNYKVSGSCFTTNGLRFLHDYSSFNQNFTRTVSSLNLLASALFIISSFMHRYGNLSTLNLGNASVLLLL